VVDPVAETIDVYDLIADEYTSRWQDPVVMAYQYGFFGGSLPGPRVLDVGCGPGRDAKFLSESGCEVTGVDLSRSLITIAAKAVTETRFALMDMRRLGFADGLFQGLWSNASFLHIPHKESLTTMRELARVTAPGGILYLSVKDGEGQGFDERGVFYAYYHLEEVGRLAQVAGFEVIQLFVNPAPHAVFIDLFARRML
jgi:ubiquinone/menaquinone biosynthesis C-methylase UbiE